MNVAKTLTGKRVLFAGATGFVGKVSLSMLLHRYGDVLDKVYVLTRKGSCTSAERRFFERWSQKQHGIVNDQWAVDRGGPPPTRNVPGQQFSNPPPIPAGGIIGLFPEPGGSR